MPVDVTVLATQLSARVPGGTGRYTSELEKLVTAIALKTREIRTAEGR